MTDRAPLDSLRRSNRSALLLAAAWLLCGSGVAHAGPGPVLVDNGTVALGVDPYASLNVPIGLNAALTGLFDIATGLDGTRGGTPYEGWGIADLDYPLGGGAVSVVSGTLPPENLTLVDWGVSGSGTLGNSAGDSVFTVHHLGIPPPTGPNRGGNTLLVIRHDFRPASNARLYEIEITVTNNFGAAVRPRYRRLVDWDVEPTALTEWVTIEHGTSSAVVASVGNFFFFPVNPNPLVPLPGGLGPQAPARSPQAEGFVPCPVNASFVDCGPGDQAAAIDFEFPSIPPGGTLKFWLYYGTAPDEPTALAALDDVGASAYSLGQSVASGATVGAPVTFIFGFKEPWVFEEDFEADTTCNWTTAAGTSEVCSNWCGDGELQFGEQCDDGNLDPDDGCDATCQIEPPCGNGALDDGEECDDGNLDTGDGCDAACQNEPGCGNGEIDPGEQCDDGNVTPGDGCNENCVASCVGICGSSAECFCDDECIKFNDCCFDACAACGVCV